MSAKDDSSVIIDIPKLREFGKRSFRVPNKKVIKHISKQPIRKPSEVSITKFSLPGDKPLLVNTLKREAVLLPFKLYSKKQEKEKHKQRLSINIYDKYKIINTELRRRLFVDSKRDDVHALTDIDGDYFRYVDGRPLLHNMHAFKSLSYLISSQLRMRQEIGYRNDDILNIEANHRKELDIYNQSTKRYKKQLKCFDDFILENYQKSRACLIKWDELVVKLNSKISDLQNLATEKFTIMSRLIGLDYMYGLQQKYGRFLYYLSPPIWRSKNRDFARSVEIEAKGFDFGISNEEDTFNAIFEKMQKECYFGLVKPVLYFTYPDDLMEIFDRIEKQQLHHFSHVTHMTPHAKTLRDGIKRLKDIMAQESAGVLNTIQGYKNLLKFSEDRCSELEAKFFKILTGSFYGNVGVSEVLKLKLHLEFCFEKVYYEKPMNADIVTTARAIENMYMDYSQRIDAIHTYKVRQAVCQCLESERKKLRQAKLASRELYFFNRLERDLRRTYTLRTTDVKALPVIKRSTIRRKVKQHSSKPNIESNHRALTEAEKEYLTLFTNWTENDDPANYLQSLSITSEEVETALNE